MVLKQTYKYKTKDGKPKKFYSCSMWATTGCNSIQASHPDGRPMGFQADEETKQLRMQLHALMEAVFGKWEDRESKIGMYSWLKANAPKDHVSEMDAAECKITIRLLEMQNSL